MNYVNFIPTFVISFCCFAQKDSSIGRIEHLRYSPTDTVNIDYVSFKKCFLDDTHLYKTHGKCYYNGTQITKAEFNRIDSFYTHVCDNYLLKQQGKYCRFLINDSIIKQEGIWYREYFIGSYKEYFENGGLKTEGFFTDGKDGREQGLKTGKWRFYNRKGKLIKVINYSG